MFTPPIIIGVTGRASAGKDTVCDMAVKLLAEQHKKAKKIALAAPLKSMCAELFSKAYDIPDDAFNGCQDDKNRELEQLPGWTGRKILQHIGTEGFRVIAPNLWSAYMVGTANALFAEGHQVAFVCDVRFLNEATAIHDAGGIIIRVKRPIADQGTNQGIKGHASEMEIAQIEADFTINNLGRSLPQLEGLVKDLLCQLELLHSTQKPQA